MQHRTGDKVNAHMRAHTQTGKTKGRQENDKTACTLHPGRRGTKNNLFVLYSQSGGFCESRDVRAPNFCQNLLIVMQIKVNPKFKVAQTPGDRWRSAFYCGVWCQEAEPISLLSFFFPPHLPVLWQSHTNTASHAIQPCLPRNAHGIHRAARWQVEAGQNQEA